jgi:hypothetical protein
MTTLLKTWISQREFFESKSVEQLIAIAGDGTLKDGNETSRQIRELFANIPSTNLSRYIEECLGKSFTNSGLVLQDLINEVGRRLGFQIEPGFYRGGGKKIGFDGIWRTKSGYAIVIEVKTTDAYQLNLDTQAKYRNRLIDEKRIEESDSSILLVVGRNDTGGLEAQTRGSRHAWDVRLISVDALLKLMLVKESLSDDDTVDQIHQILKPLEYTRLDQLVDIIFNTSEDLQSDEDVEDTPEVESEGEPKKKPVNYHAACIERIEKKLKTPLVKNGRTTYKDSTDSLRLTCIVSKEYVRSGSIRYWYAFHPVQQIFLKEVENSHIALGCGSENEIILMPFSSFEGQLSEMRTTESNERYYWHVEIFKKDGFYLLNKPTSEGLDISEFLI